MTTHFKLESIRNSWVGEEAVALNYFDTVVGGELDTVFTALQTEHGTEYVYNDAVTVCENVRVTYGMMFGNTADRRLHTVGIDAVVDEDGCLWADAVLFETELC